MKRFPLVEAIGFAVFLICDQITKIIVVQNLTYGASIPIIDGFLHITNTHNTGTIWGLAQGGNMIFAILAIVVVILIVVLTPKVATTKIARFAIGAILGGAIGNLLDRFVRGFVVDFIDFRVINFPVFNVADIGIVCGAITLGIFMFLTPQKSN